MRESSRGVGHNVALIAGVSIAVLLVIMGCNDTNQRRTRTGVVRGTSEAPVVVVPEGHDSLAITTWLLGGAFPSEPLLNAPTEGPFRDGYDRDFLTEIGGEENARPRPGTVVTAPGGEPIEFFTFQWDSAYCDLTKAPFGTIIFVTAYMYCELESPVDQTVFLHVGTNDCGQVWLNGKRVIAYSLDRGAQPSQNVAEVHLNAGRNRLLMKIGQAGANWGAFAQIYGPDAHREFVEENFPEEFDLNTNENVLAEGDTAIITMTNWPDWPEPLVPVTWTITENDCTTVMPTTGPVKTDTFIVPPGAPRAVKIRTEAVHPNGKPIEGEVILYVGGDEYSDYFPPGTRPDHIAMSLGDNARTERRVAWRTSTRVRRSVAQLVATDRAPDDVRFAGAAVREMTGESRIAESTRGRYRAHEVTVGELRPGTRYVYRVGDGTRRHWSEPYAFTVPAAGATSTIAVTGGGRIDLTTWGNIAESCVERRPDFILNTGNMVSDGRSMDDWSRWFNETREVFPTVPFMPVVGSLERRAPTYLNAFALPENAPNSELRELCYSFDMGPVHWVVLDSEFRLQEQARWLREDLAHSEAPWKIAAFHRPAYTGHPREGEGDWQIREFWVDELEGGSVDMAIQGHYDFYYRTKPLRDSREDEDGIVYITTGGAGTGATFSTSASSGAVLKYDPNPWMAAAAEDGHYIILTASPQELAGTVYSVSGEILDEFSMKR